MRERTEEKMDKRIWIVIIIILLSFLIPHGAFAACTNQDDYLTCLNNDPNPLVNCACCLFSQGGDYHFNPSIGWVRNDGSVSCSLSTFVPCINSKTKPIGILITASNVHIYGGEIDGTGPSIEGCCNIGIEVGAPSTSQLSGVKILSGVAVKEWSKGILFWKVTSSEISNSFLSDNTWGIHFFWAEYNNVFSNRIEGNEQGLHIQEPIPKSTHNSFYNNIFYNSINVYLSNNPVKDNSFFIPPPSPPILNVVCGSNIGGSYWSTPEGTGWSESSQCNCNTTSGFCQSPYMIGGQHFDDYPLCNPKCEPTVSFEVTPLVTFPSSLIAGQDNPLYDQLTVSLDSNINWQITLSPNPSTGRMESGSLSLEKELEIGDLPSNMKKVTMFVPIGPTNNYQHTYDLSQEVVLTDKQGGTYQIELIFTATPEV